jgi:predicted nucleic acid-binding protein
MLFDTGVLYAAMDASDAHHADAIALVAGSAPVLVPAPVLVELDWLGSSRGVPTTEALLTGISEGSIRVVDLMISDYERARELCSTYADMSLGLVDAAVVAVAERLDDDTIATTDRRHFAVVRPAHVEAFTLLP